MEELIVRVLCGEATDREAQQLEAWRAESADHERTFVQMRRLWEATAPSATRAVSTPPPVATIVAEAERRRGNVVALAGWRRKRGWALVSGLAAAAVLLLAIGITRFSQPWGSTYTTGLGEVETVTLDDGSVVRLGAGSALRVARRSSRSLRLDGRAFFAVVTDSATPFTVETSAGRAEVLGTRFEIASSTDSLRLVVIEGRVALDASGTRVEVAHGEVSRVTAGSAPSSPVQTDVWALLDWPSGLLIFQATPLIDVLAQIERHFGVPVVIADTALGKRTVTARFDDEPLEDVMGTVCAVVGARCTVGATVEVAP